MFERALTVRSERPADLLSVYGHATRALAWYAAVRRACDDYLGDQLPPPHWAPGYYAAVEAQQTESRSEEAALRELVKRIEAELGVR